MTGRLSSELIFSHRMHNAASSILYQLVSYLLCCGSFLWNNLVMVIFLSYFLNSMPVWIKHWWSAFMVGSSVLVRCCFYFFRRDFLVRADQVSMRAPSVEEAKKKKSCCPVVSVDGLINNQYSSTPPNHLQVCAENRTSMLVFVFMFVWKNHKLSSPLGLRDSDCLTFFF